MAINSNMHLQNQQLKADISRNRKAMVGMGQTGVTKQQTESKKKTVQKQKGDGVDLSLTKALEDAKNQDSSKVARESVMDEAARSNAKKKDIEGDHADRETGRPGVEEQPKPGFVFVEGADGDDKYQIEETKANAVARMDSKSFSEKLNSDMPTKNREMAEATLNTQIETKGTDSVSQMKMGDTKFNDSVEGMDLEPAEDFTVAGSQPAEIRSPKHQKPMMVEDEQSEKLAKEAAAQQLAAGGGSEAFVA